MLLKSSLKRTREDRGVEFWLLSAEELGREELEMVLRELRSGRPAERTGLDITVG